MTFGKTEKTLDLEAASRFSMSMKPSFSVLDMLPDEGGIIMNETLKTLVERRSCRSYKPDPVPAEIMDQKTSYPPASNSSAVGKYSRFPFV